MTLLTLFTAPKPFTDPHISVIQYNTLRNWQALGEAVEVLVVGDEPGIAEACRELRVRHCPGVKTNASGTPLISSIFNLARTASNADILFLPDLVQGTTILARSCDQFLAVGQRYDLDITESLDFSEGWDQALQERVAEKGRLHGQSGSDYFIFPRQCFANIPDFAVGRAGWDNWMLFWARWQHWPLVDATSAITLVHQNHDYRHLPGGLKHFFQAETGENV